MINFTFKFLCKDLHKNLLFESPDFFELNLKFSYIFELKRLDSSLELFGGINNMLNHYQDDFDSGKNRDSGYIYGSAKPCHFFTGLKIFN
jgi:outer membrane receptor for ferrienterochelin and colicins